MLTRRMRKMLLTCTAAMFIGLAGCTSTQVTDFLGQVQAAAANVCKFVPTIDTILSVAATLGFSPAVAAAGAINAVAATICSQVPPPASARYRALSPQGGGPAKNVGNVGGVPINGWRVP